MELYREATQERKRVKDIGDAFQVDFGIAREERITTATNFGKQAVVNASVA